MRWTVLLVVSLLFAAPANAATVNQTGYWTFDEGAGSFAADSAGGRTATLSGGAAWAPGVKGYALALNGTSAYADAGVPVVDTTKSFSVSARVKLNALTSYQTMVSVDGNLASGFYLQFRAPDGNRFAFVRLPADQPVTAGSWPMSAPITAGQWYMVTGVYDAAANTSTLYVDDRREAVTAAPPPWKANGHFVIGRALYGAFVDYVNGAIDEVRTFDGALSAAQVAELYATGSYRVIVDDDGDNTAVPADCNDRDASVHPGAVDVPGDGIDQDCVGGDALPDRDGDGYRTDRDCDDSVATTHPGTGEIAGNGTDENCDGVAASAEMGATVRNDWAYTTRTTRVNILLVRNAPASTSVELRCRGRGCPFAKRVIRSAKGGNVNVRTPLRRAKLRVGTVLEVRVSAPFHVTKVARFTMRRNKLPLTTYLCLPAGATKPRRC
jgi:hypothetical protein